MKPHITVEEKYPCECGFPRFDCGECHDTGEVLHYYEDDTGRCLEYEVGCSNTIHEDLNKGLWTP